MDVTLTSKRVLLVILDGWGVGPENETNAVYVAQTPFMDALTRKYPSTTLIAHNGAVGLPEGQMGNSEVGHLNIGAGRIVYQDYTRINKAIDTGELGQNQVLLKAINQLQASGKTLHLMGLVSDGGVHSHLRHLVALVNTAADHGLKDIAIHCYMDGRDTPPKSGSGYLGELQQSLQAIGAGRIATIIGRYYAMDRDRRWDRVARAWDALVNGKGIMEHDPLTAIENAYERGETDEFVQPLVITDGEDQPVGTIKDGDAVLFFNFRADRARQLTHAFTDNDFAEFSVANRPKLATFVTCTQYDKEFDLPILFPPQSLTRILGEEISRQGIRQLRIAETEKYAHVTYFFNGGREAVYDLEERELIESPRDVPTYDKKPEMSAPKVTERLLEKLEQNDYGLIVLNYANGDMVGHSGILEAAVKACETVDHCLEQLVPAFLQKGGAVLITADHGNAETMYDVKTQGPHTAHTLDPVPFILVSDQHIQSNLKNGGALRDIAPTILSLLGLDIPAEMDGTSLIMPDAWV